MSEKRDQLPDIVKENQQSLAEDILSPKTLEELKKRAPDLSERIFAELNATSIISICQEIEQVEGFSGPIPPPRTLKEYEAAHAGLAERIVIMAEKEQTHRHSMDTLVATSTVREKKRGQAFGFIIGTTALIASCVLGLNGATTVASIIGGTSVVGLVTVFVIGKKAQKSAEDEEGGVEKEGKLQKKTTRKRK
jgi:uncharacterized membrane protein